MPPSPPSQFKHSAMEHGSDVSVRTRPPLDSFRAATYDFFHPFAGLRVSRVILWSAAFILVIVSFVAVCFQGSVNNVTRRNGIEATLLASEAKHEQGPDFIRAAHTHHKLLQEFSKRLSERKMGELAARTPAGKKLAIGIRAALIKLATVPKSIDPTCDSHTEFDLEMGIINKEPDNLQQCKIAQNKAKKVILEAGEILSAAAQNAASIRKQLALSTLPSQGDDFKDVDLAMANFTRAFEAFTKEKCSRNAEAACAESRLLHSAVISSLPEFKATRGNEGTAMLETIPVQFLKLSKSVEDYAAVLPFKTKTLLNAYARNISQRASSLSILLKKGFDEVPKTLNHEMSF